MDRNEIIRGLLTMHRFLIGQQVKAKICNTISLGVGVITLITEDNNQPLYRVQTEDGNYPLYENELAPHHETKS